MQKPIAHTDVIVIGGGLAGLTTACYLARGGVSVALFEKASSIGGRASTDIEDGYAFNRGAHALYTGGATSEVLQELDINYGYGIPRDTFILHQGKFDTIPTNPKKLLRNSLLTVSDKLDLMRLFTTLPRLQASSVAHMSAQAWIEQNIHQPQAQQLLTSFARTFSYSAALNQVSAELFIMKLQLSLKHPIHYINGGWQVLVDALRQRAEQAGACITSGVRVASVIHNNGSVEGIQLDDGSIVRAQAVIIATEPHSASKLVDEGANPALRQVVATGIPVQIACLDVALSRLPSTRYPVVQDLDHPRFLTTQSLYSQVAPQGGGLVCTFKHLDPEHPTSPHDDERDLEDLLDCIQPGWRDVLVRRSFLPRINAAGLLPTAAGGGFAGRPASQIPGIADLYLAGDWVGPEGYQSDASMSSGRQAARHVLRTNALATSNQTPAEARS